MAEAPTTQSEADATGDGLPSIVQRNVSLTMVRRSLEGLPRHPLPPGYAIRHYEAGDVSTWVAIQSAAERFNAISPELHRKEFGDDERLIRQRQFFLVDPAGEAVGTATAWHGGPLRDPRFGRVHWVAIRPGQQGRGLAKPLLAAVCAALRELGHDRAFLATSSARIPALRLYLEFGFEPEIKNADDAAAWTELEAPLAAAGRRSRRA